jgi:thiosulfate/3-mercaptopyruvate sulfurtransferase
MHSNLISASELAGRLHRPDLIVVDCRFNLLDPAAGRVAWQAGHIPGAVFADLNEQLSATVSAAAGGRHPLPDARALCRTLGQLGIGNHSQVVAYDDASGMLAGRLWWLLRWLGHTRVAVLDSGLPAWEAAGQSLSTDPQTPPPQQFQGEPGQMPVVDAAELAAGLGDGRRRLVDVRTSVRFRGQSEPIDKLAGHVPGAINLPLERNLNASGSFRSAVELAELYQPYLDGGSAGSLVLMCGSGVSACHSLLALDEAGLPGAALYPGSWSDWISDPSRPVATD